MGGQEFVCTLGLLLLASAYLPHTSLPWLVLPWHDVAMYHTTIRIIWAFFQLPTGIKYTTSTVSLKVFIRNITVWSTKTHFLPAEFRRIRSSFIGNNRKDWSPARNWQWHLFPAQCCQLPNKGTAYSYPTMPYLGCYVTAWITIR
jgi:hypothetical protein